MNDRDAGRRADGRGVNETRPIAIERGFTRHAEGSVLVSFGDTRVICTASVDTGVPPFLKGTGRGWVTAEYGMLPRSTGTRMEREAVRGKQDGRTVEIQRLIGRSLRAVVDLAKIGERTIRIDCDVIQADGGTRTASITGGCVALIDAARALGGIRGDPVIQLVASVSVGLVGGVSVVDLNYIEDSDAGTDLNVVMQEDGTFIEVQGTGEDGSFSRTQLNEMLDLAQEGIEGLFEIQRSSLART